MQAFPNYGCAVLTGQHPLTAAVRFALLPLTTTNPRS